MGVVKWTLLSCVVCFNGCKFWRHQFES